jgi:hypothetical protein
MMRPDLFGEIERAAHRRGVDQPYQVDRIVDWLQFMSQTSPQATVLGAPPAPIQPALMVDQSTIHLVDNTTMIHDMLRRGYAVMKLPESGKPATLVEPDA